MSWPAALPRPLPETVARTGSRHLLYRTAAPGMACLARELEWVARAVRAKIAARPLATAEIEVSSFISLERHLPAGVAPGQFEDGFRALSQALPGGCLAESPNRLDDLEVVYCQWASPHVDEMWAGRAFVCYVVDTGPHPYVLQLFHTQKKEVPEDDADQGRTRVAEVICSTRILRTGDCFVFDPAVTHMVAPAFPHQDQLLILLQRSVPDYGTSHRRALLEAMPVLENDRDDGRQLG